MIAGTKIENSTSSLEAEMQVSESENKTLVQWLVEELFNRKRPEVIEFLYASGCCGSTPDGAFGNRNEFLLGFAQYAKAFPDSRMEIDYLVADGDRVIVHYTFEGTNTGAWAGLLPTNRLLRIAGVMITRITNSRIVQQDFLWDALEARRQFLAAPLPALDYLLLPAA
ncbi:MAG: hypothetical protein C5B51_06730 [Terriglobia bacterium]|nr:MAG: hypothetical protein C5B51_06730 [Terriglobia bacterium]